MNDYTIRRLQETDAESLRAARLDSLKRYPLNYTGTYDDEARHDAAWFAAQTQSSLIFGVLTEGGELVGTACLSPDVRPRNEHKATLRMVYIAPAHQGRGLSRRLLEVTLAEGAHHFEQAVLSVEASNTPAVKLYLSLGFVEYGREPHASKLPDGSYLDDILMVKFFGRCY